jgi:Zn-dependent peptidase ImmA (M78 family)
MTRLNFVYDWQVAGNDAPEYRQTMAALQLHVGTLNLMRNQDIWSRTIQESVLVSAYPLAMWLASSWWRLHWEPLPAHGVPPSVDWRMAHEMGAANYGFVWPQIVFASDSEVMQVWAVPLRAGDGQSVRYLDGLDMPASIALPDFQRTIGNFIVSVISRLDATDCHNTELSNLWQIIQEELSEPESTKYRRIEAEMGYDPDECPDELMNKAMKLGQEMGAAALSELAPIYGKSASQTPLAAIEELAESGGMVGTPTVLPPPYAETAPQGAPWERAVATAGALRKMLGNLDRMMDTGKLSELLGLSETTVEEWSPVGHSKAAIAVRLQEHKFKFIPRKKHPIGKRFELARLIGDYLLTTGTNGNWLTSTDLSTSRQKFQRAFAAEFLCPIAKLREFLQEDYSESAIEDAAQHFQVSQRTVESLLVNNGLLPSTFVAGYVEDRLPYKLGI